MTYTPNARNEAGSLLQLDVRGNREALRCVETTNTNAEAEAFKWPPSQKAQIPADIMQQPSSAHGAHVQDDVTAWLYSRGAVLDREGQISNCAPEECFLHITAELNPHGDSNSNTCQALFEASPGIDTEDGDDVAVDTAEHLERVGTPHIKSIKPFAQFTHVMMNHMQRFWCRVSAGLTSLFDQACFMPGLQHSSSVNSVTGQSNKTAVETETLRVQACMQNVLDVVAAPHRPYMQGLTAMPSQDVIEGLASEPQHSEAQVFFSEFKKAYVAKPNVSLSNFRSLSPNVVEVDVSSDYVAAYVTFETTLPGTFSDNAILLLPWESKTVAFLSEKPVHPDMLAESLTVLSLFDTSISM